MSRLVQALDSGAEQAFVIARNVTPVARIGCAKEKFMTTGQEPTLDAAVSELFFGQNVCLRGIVD